MGRPVLGRQGQATAAAFSFAKHWHILTSTALAAAPSGGRSRNAGREGHAQSQQVEEVFLPEVQWVPEGPNLQGVPAVPEMKPSMHKVAHHPDSEQMGRGVNACNGNDLRSAEGMSPESWGTRKGLPSVQRGSWGSTVLFRPRACGPLGAQSPVAQVSTGHGHGTVCVRTLTGSPDTPGSPFSPFAPGSPCWQEAQGTAHLRVDPHSLQHTCPPLCRRATSSSTDALVSHRSPQMLTLVPRALTSLALPLLRARTPPSGKWISNLAESACH